jgi:ribulose-5-phosphate 4-epimerase/fuculose-1-phosphate aldolase
VVTEEYPLSADNSFAKMSSSGSASAGTTGSAGVRSAPKDGKSNAGGSGNTDLEEMSAGIPLPPPPRGKDFPSYEDHRNHIKRHMCAAFRSFARRDFSEGMSGHISVRDPEHQDNYWTNPLGRHFAMMRPSDLVLVDESGEPVGGNKESPVNAAGFFIHTAIHKARKDVQAAVHMHSPAGKAFSMFGTKIDMLNQDACMFYGENLGVYERFGGTVMTEEEGEKLASNLGKKAMILKNHGLITVGTTVDEAATLFINLEQACHNQLLVEAACAGGSLKKTVIEDKIAEETCKDTTHPVSLPSELHFPG